MLGMGGSGKTQLALEFCRQAEEDLGFTAVFWINASSLVSVIQSYKAVATKILKDHHGDASSENMISLVQDTLREWKRPWLCVFDNYDTPKAFEPTGIHHYIPGGTEGRILFTSRHQDSARLGHRIEISVMTENESLEVLLQRLPRNDEEARYAREIAATLGYLALALDQAGSYIRAHKVRLGDFVTHYHKCKEQIVKTIPDVWEYQTAVSDEEKGNKLKIYTTWELSFKQTTGSEQELRQKEHLLSLAAFLDVTRISERYFEAYFKPKKREWMAILSSEDRWDRDKLGVVLAEFHKLSLIKMQKHAMDQLLFSIHPVIRDWIQIRMSRELRQHYAQESITMLESYLRSYNSYDLPLETNQETLLHVDSCVRHDKDLLSGSSFRGLDLRSSASCFASFYSDQGRYRDAKYFYERALSDCLKRKVPTHIHTFGLTSNLALVLSQQERYDEAEKILDRSLTEAKKNLGARHPETLGMMEILATAVYYQGRYSEAEQHYKMVLMEREEELGTVHPHTLKTMGNLASVYSDQRRYDDVEKLLERVLISKEEELGANHPSTLHTVHNLGLLYHEQCRYHQAQNFLERALTGRKEKLGVTHPETQKTARALATSFRVQGRRDEAKRVAEEFDLVWSDEKRQHSSNLSV